MQNNKFDKIIPPALRGSNFGGVLTAIMVGALMLMVMMLIRGGLAVGFVIAMIPFVILLIRTIIIKPYLGFVFVFYINYFMIAIFRYSDMTGLSVFIDVMIALIFVSILLNRVLINPDKNYYKVFNGLFIVSIVWFAYCALELLNPTAMVEAWTLSRGLAYYMFLIVTLTYMLFDDFKKVDSILFMLSFLTLIGVGKALMQKFMGFDSVELRLLSEGMAQTHLIASGPRYFSFYASAGIFGAVMGHALVVYAILAIYSKSNGRRIYYLFVAAAALYGMLISGTRGALAVPGAGFILFVILTKQIKIMIPTGILVVGAYVILTMTNIGQGNEFIRRMRSAFDPQEPSLVVRLQNQQKLGEYLQHKPFGEGLGLSGVEANSLSDRFTTTIPNDSWFVKIWVETGIVGLVLYLSIMIYVILHGAYVTLFKLKNPYVRGVTIAMVCGICGILASSYGNQVLGQFPVAMIMYMSMAFVFMSTYFDKLATKSEI